MSKQHECKQKQSTYKFQNDNENTPDFPELLCSNRGSYVPKSTYNTWHESIENQKEKNEVIKELTLKNNPGR